MENSELDSLHAESVSTLQSVTYERKTPRNRRTLDVLRVRILALVKNLERKNGFSLVHEMSTPRCFGGYGCLVNH